MARTRQRPKLTPEQRALSKARTAAMWDDIQAARVQYNNTISNLAKAHSKSEQWVAAQLFRGGKLLRARRKKNIFNAIVHDLAKKRKEIENVSPEGRQTLARLAQQASEVDVQNLPETERKRLLEQLEEDSVEPVSRIPAKAAGHQVDGTIRRILPELDGLAARTGCQYLFVVTRADVADNWTMRTATTPQIAEGLAQIFKCTPDTLGMKLDAFCTSGLAGVLKVTGGKRSTALKGEIRAKIAQGLEEITADIPSENRPRMRWTPAKYKLLTAEYGVELHGWRDADSFCNPSDLKRIAELEELHAALHAIPPECFWVKLSAEEWEKRKDTYRTELLKKAAAKKGKKPISPETVPSDEEDEEDGREPHVTVNV
ncbi:hypothetical protein NUW54_g8128 [Trametes sanguinea]|uniref:Uncharacterized protein n=1 Tax=Trametes sanguinea TaxID=158606 RepID=A0ACC1PI31_9APHY|nr:hypothetical protein NUW54_g8128 [Trametes sanguinea]